MEHRRSASKALHSAAKFAVVLVGACCAANLSAQAQSFDESTTAGYWTVEKQRQDRLRTQRPPILKQKPTHLIRRAAPVRGYARPLEPEPAPQNEDTPSNIATPAVTLQPEPSAAAPAQQAPTPRNDAKANIAVLGDTLAQLLSAGLSEAFADRPDIAIQKRTKENSGLTREDYYDWPKAARELLSGKDKPDIAILMIGSNDRQSLRTGRASLDLRSPKWKELYTARAKAIGALFKERNIPLVWVGLPIMNNERYADDIVDFNEIYEIVSQETGARFVDVWEAFADDRGHFSSYGPDINGQMVRLRASDGVHFTRAGARKLAHFVEREIRDILDKTKPAIDASPVAALPPAAPPEISPDPAPAPAPVPKPAAGPVAPLTASPVAVGGILLRARERQSVDTLIEKSLVEGRALDARPGRADDFTWPRK